MLTKEAIERAGKLARESLVELTEEKRKSLEPLSRVREDFISNAERNGVDKEALKVLKKEAKE